LVRDQLRALSRHTATPAGVLVERTSQQLMAASRRFLSLPLHSRVLFITGVLAVALALVSAALRRGGPSVNVPPAADSGSAGRAPDGSLADRALKLAERMVDDEPPAKPEPKPATIPKELEPDVQLMLDSSRSSERRRAALKVLRYKGPTRLPAHVLAIARLEKARTCRERQDAISEIDELHDPRCRPALRRLSESPRNGCGFLGLSDCYGCIRADLRTTLDHLAKD
jgi:hypothetical protein